MSPRAILVLGACRAGKTRALLDRYAATVSRGEQGIWLAPNATAVAEVRDALAARAEGAWLAPGVATFAGFAEQLLLDGRVPARPLAPGESVRLLELAVAELGRSGRLKHFARVADTPGFVAQAAEFIASAKRRDAWAEDLQKTARGPRDRELAALYGEYQRLLAKSRAFDAEGLFWAARDVVKRNPALLAGVSLAVVDGFNDFTAAQYDILQRVASSAAELRIALTLDDSARPDLFGTTTATRQALRQRMKCEEIEAEPDVAAGEPEGIRLIAEGLFHADAESCEVPAEVPNGAPGDAAIEMIAAPSSQREQEEVARRVKRLLAGGAAAEGIVIALRNSAEHAARLRAVMADYGVPTWFDARPPLAGASVVRSLLNLLRLHAEDWPYRRLLTAATARQIQWRGGDLALHDHHRRGAVEQAIRTAQIAGGSADLLEHLAARVDRYEEESSVGSSDFDDPAGRVAQVALPQLLWLQETLAALPKRAALATWISRLEDLAAAAGLLHEQSQGAWGAWAAALEAALRAERWAYEAPQPIDLADFIALAARVAVRGSAPAPSDATGRVRVLAADRARHVRAEHLFVAGLSEQSFPAPVREDRQRADDRLSEWIGPDAEDVAAETPTAGEMLLFYQLVNRPTRTLTLSYPALDGKAQPLSPSPYLVELHRCCAAHIRTTVIPLTGPTGELPQRPGDPASASELRRQAVAEALDDSPQLLAAMVAASGSARVGRAMVDGLETVGARAVRDAFGPWEGVLLGEAARADFAKRFGAEHLWSPSQLESYALCPFKFFGEQVLHLQPAPNLVLQSDLGRRGVMLHETLAALHRRRADAHDPAEPTATTPEELEALRDDLAAEYRQSLAELAPRAPRIGLDAALWEIERRQIDSWAEQLADQELRYRGFYASWDAPPEPRYFEARFGPGSRRSESAADADVSTDEPYRLQLATEQLRLTGQIDRIDVGTIAGQAAFNVIDYKTSARATVKPNQVADGRQLQLPLYAMAAQELLLAAQDAVAWSAGYWSVQGKGLGKPGNKGGPLQVTTRGDSELVADPAWTATQDRLRERVAEIVAGIRRAEFPVFSADKDCTGYCPLRTACRVAHVRSLQKTWQGEAMAKPDEED